jgi:hypothetical protein
MQLAPVAQSGVKTQHCSCRWAAHKTMLLTIRPRPPDVSTHKRWHATTTKQYSLVCTRFKPWQGGKLLARGHHTLKATLKDTWSAHQLRTDRARQTALQHRSIQSSSWLTTVLQSTLVPKANRCCLAAGKTNPFLERFTCMLCPIVVLGLPFAGASHTHALRKTKCLDRYKLLDSNCSKLLCTS